MTSRKDTKSLALIEIRCKLEGVITASMRSPVFCVVSRIGKHKCHCTSHQTANYDQQAEGRKDAGFRCDLVGASQHNARCGGTVC
jgi:hypothetical protein